MPRVDRGGTRAAAGAAGGVLSILPPRRLRCACHVTVSCRSSALHTVLPKLTEADSACARDDTQLLDLLHRAPRVLMRKRAA